MKNTCIRAPQSDLKLEVTSLSNPCTI